MYSSYVVARTPWRDGTTHLVMSPLEFMQGLAALVPRPRLHLIRFHGVLAPNAKLRALMVPQPPPAQAQTSAEAADTDGCEVETVQDRPYRISLDPAVTPSLAAPGAASAGR